MTEDVTYDCYIESHFKCRGFGFEGVTGVDPADFEDPDPEICGCYCHAAENQYAPRDLLMWHEDEQGQMVRTWPRGEQ